MRREFCGVEAYASLPNVYLYEVGVDAAFTGNQIPFNDFILLIVGSLREFDH